MTFDLSHIRNLNHPVGQASLPGDRLIAYNFGFPGT